MNASKWSLQNDIFDFLHKFSTAGSISFEVFRAHWQEIDMDLLCIVADSESITDSLISYGLFGPNRPFSDHQLLVYFLFSFFKATHKSIKLSPECIKILMNMKMRAELLNDHSVVLALRALFKNEAFVIVASTQSFSSISHQSSAPPVNLTSEQLRERIRRIEAFIIANPLQNQKISKSTFTRLKGILDRYSQAASTESSHDHDNNSSSNNINNNLQSIMNSVIQVVELYEKSIEKYNFSSAQQPRTVRSRLSKSSLLTPQPADIFLSRSQSVPLLNSLPVQKPRKTSTSATSATSGLRDTATDQFMSTNMPNIDNIHFY